MTKSKSINSFSYRERVLTFPTYLRCYFRGSLIYRFISSEKTIEIKINDGTEKNRAVKIDCYDTSIVETNGKKVVIDNLPTKKEKISKEEFELAYQRALTEIDNAKGI